MVKFMETLDSYQKEVEGDINKGVSLLNIEYYMRDLRKNAIEEYDEVLQIEEKLMKDPNIPMDKNQKLNIRYGILTSAIQNENEMDLNNQINSFIGGSGQGDDLDLSMLDAKEKKKLKKKQRKRDKKIKQQMA